MVEKHIQFDNASGNRTLRQRAAVDAVIYASVVGYAGQTTEIGHYLA